MYKAREANEAEAPVLHRIVRRLSQKAGMPMPKVYIILICHPCFATAETLITLLSHHRSIMQLLTEEELAGVMAHETFACAS